MTDLATRPRALAVAPEEQLQLHFDWRQFDEPSLVWTHPGSEDEVSFGAAYQFTPASDIQPRHRHVMEQLRFIVSGAMTYGPNRVATAGDLIYFPESIHYGPVQWEEGEHFALQWTGPSEHGGFYVHEDLVKAKSELAEIGEFDLSKGGMFRRPDGRLQDGYEAIAEHLGGSAPVYDGARYQQQLCMKTGQFPSSPVRGAPGVAVKHLGYFNECGPNVKLYELAPGATVPEGEAQSQQIWTTLFGAFSYDGQDYPRRSLVYAAPGARREAITATEPTTLLVMHLRTATGPQIPFFEL